MFQNNYIVIFEKKYVIINCKLHIFSSKQLCVRCDNAQGSLSQGSAESRVASAPSDEDIFENSCLGPGLQGPVGATLRGRRANDRLEKTVSKGVAKNSRIQIIGAITTSDTALSRGTIIPSVSRRYWPRARTLLRAGLTPLSTLDREIQGLTLTRVLVKFRSVACRCRYSFVVCYRIRTRRTKPKSIPPQAGANIGEVAHP